MKINDPFVFYTAAGLLLAYLLYTMLRKRHGLRPGEPDREPDL
ncbi:hypothetical protein EP7_004561 [Isosphaeraceae bacterium EP7]